MVIFGKLFFIVILVINKVFYSIRSKLFNNYI